MGEIDYFERLPDEPGTHLLTFGPAGVGANWWRPVAETLPSIVHLVAPRLPGRETRVQDPPCHTVRAAIDDVMRWLAPRLDVWTGDVFVVGVCSGCVLARALAEAIAGSGRCTADVVILNPPTVVREPGRAIAELTSRELLTELVADGLIDESVGRNEQLFRFFEPTIRADMAMIDAYARDPLPVSVSARVLAQSDCIRVSHDWVGTDRQRGEVGRLPGDRHTLMSNPASIVGPALRDLLT